MKIIKASYEILTPINGDEILKTIELAGRVCYKSEDLISEESSKRFVANLIKNGHEAVLEFFDITVKFICDRGISHELVRHRTGNFAQESSRYCNYSKDKFGKELTFIEPCFWEIGSTNYNLWENACSLAESTYLALLATSTPQEARSVLPNSLKTEVNMKNDLRNWRHFFKLRTSKAAHPQIRELTIPLLKELQSKIPVIFDDIEVEV